MNSIRSTWSERHRRLGDDVSTDSPRRGDAVRPVAAALVVAALISAGCSDSGADAAARVKSPAAESSTTVTSPDDAAAAAGAGITHVHTKDDGSSAPDPDRPTIVAFSGAERARLAEELERAREVALRYPTLADAQAAGYEPTTPYAPGTGSHMGRDDRTQPFGTALDIDAPQSYLYDGESPNSRVVGLMYVYVGGDSSSPPDGFAGPLDPWSVEDGQCLKPGTTDPMFPAKSVTKDECIDGGGQHLPITVWLQHVWVVPGWEAPGGVFAPYNDDIVCADGSDEADPIDGCESPVRW